MKFDTLGAIDIGSNAIRLLISNVEANENIHEFKKVAFLRVPIRLGEDVFSKGKIGESKLNRLTEAMIGFSHIMKAYKVNHYMAFATSAMRGAKNGEEVIKTIYKKSGINIKTITGQEEAEIIFEAGGLSAVMDSSQNYLYVDVGGGSTEIILYSKNHKIKSRSFEIGTVRFLANAVKEEEKKAFEDWLTEIADNYAPLSIIASGGNINKIHKVLGKREKEYLTFPEIKVLYDILEKLTYEERILNYGLNPYRADVIVPALGIFIKIGEICKINEIFVPKVGIVDGMVHHIYSNLHSIKKETKNQKRTKTK
ncbi:MAG: hypothetical protein LIO65_03265 [Odoribacter sp.]|nr:hypothetical protein [Odoribacter sp.]